MGEWNACRNSSHNTNLEDTTITQHRSANVGGNVVIHRVELHKENHANLDQKE